MDNPIFAHVGLEHVVQINRVIAIVPPNLRSGRQYLDIAKGRGMHIDASRGRPFRSLLILDDGTVITSAISVMTLLKRFRNPLAKIPDNYMVDDANDLLDFDDTDFAEGSVVQGGDG